MEKAQQLTGEGLQLDGERRHDHTLMNVNVAA